MLLVILFLLPSVLTMVALAITLACLPMVWASLEAPVQVDEPCDWAALEAELSTPPSPKRPRKAKVARRRQMHTVHACHAHVRHAARRPATNHATYTAHLVQHQRGRGPPPPTGVDSGKHLRKFSKNGFPVSYAVKSRPGLHDAHRNSHFPGLFHRVGGPSRDSVPEGEHQTDA
jgi:hypothetical protein